jgi:type VI secretion system secreted protein VgrG
MASPLKLFFDHTRHKLRVRGLDATLDVLAFTGTEQLSEPYKYIVEFTCPEQDIAVDRILGKRADFSLHGMPASLAKRSFSSLNNVPEGPLRTLHGMITDFKRLSSSRDEARYEVTLQPRLALLGKGKQFRIYQQQSVPQIVESVLRSRHDFEGQDFLFSLVRDYPRRDQVMQYNESDLAFISRLLAEVGIWYRLTRDERLKIDVVEFHDDQRHYIRPRIELPNLPSSGLSDSGQDSVWALQTQHQVVEKAINFRAYHHRDARAWLDGEVDQTRGDPTTYGEAYHYGEAYSVLGDKLAKDEDLQSESGFFYARLRHERYLNDQARLSGISSLATLAPAQILKITDNALDAFKPGAVITQVKLTAARDRSLEVTFQAMPYAEDICFRPPLLPKPQIAGTVPARVASTRANDPYGHIDMEGRYKVNFLFDRDTWKPGWESMWLRLARPYAGDTHGLHLPLICGTEVAVAFEQGDIDRPYIAHALHDNKHPDHVTLGKRDYTRNVLRTPANNKLRMEDRRGEEHVKLSTEYSGKSQLNLGHLVDAEKKKRGEGFELRTDGHGAIRAGAGLFISADKQAKAQGRQEQPLGLIQSARPILRGPEPALVAPIIILPSAPPPEAFRPRKRKIAVWLGATVATILLAGGVAWWGWLADSDGHEISRQTGLFQRQHLSAEPVQLDSLHLFTPGSAEIKPDSTRLLINTLAEIKARPNNLIVITGHSDTTGDTAQNLHLSQARAMVVRDWMQRMGEIEERCFAVQGVADSQPVASNETEAGRAANRRIDIRLMPHAAC